MGCNCYAHKGISGAHPRADCLPIGIRLETIAQESSIAVIDFLEAHDCRGSIGERFGREDCGVRIGKASVSPQRGTRIQAIKRAPK